MLGRQVAQNFPLLGRRRVSKQALAYHKQFGDAPRMILTQRQAIDLIVD